MEFAYWKVVARYGHVGKRNEISVARHLITARNATPIDIMNLVEEMPGTKNRALISVKKIELYEYLEGVREEKENYYLQRLLGNKRAE